ncbi:GNAT family N-acetyltransferase [Chelatococcus reniformis]|uniref:GCN5 family acetyltransferase n=1 Tax=Chelatococcus reniformis TaxID=1494448 RepID=A0A916UHJ7_9HYPH|nr:GNAT family N-acetyltransferase [Chelatococcus reniformis]GGC73031.1 GCN5 family acetyltransferase [Chelatococcus reniformis]
MGQAFKTGLRPFLPADAPALAAIFRTAIDEIAADDYDEAQREAWASAADDEAAFGEHLAGMLTLVGVIGGSPMGFAALRGNDHVEYLYVHPAVAGQGVASQLLEALEKLAGARGATSLTTDASDTARGFFQKRGYQDLHRETVQRGGEWLGRTAMRKQLAANETGTKRS